jgi:hypothetical protein
MELKYLLCYHFYPIYLMVVFWPERKRMREGGDLRRKKKVLVRAILGLMYATARGMSDKFLEITYYTMFLELLIERFYYP